MLNSVLKCSPPCRQQGAGWWFMTFYVSQTLYVNKLVYDHNGANSPILQSTEVVNTREQVVVSSLCPVCRWVRIMSIV